MGKLARFFWLASIATRIKLGNIRISSSQLESRNYPSPCGSSSLWRMGDQSKDRGDGLFSQGHFALMRGGTDEGTLSWKGEKMMCFFPCTHSLLSQHAAEREEQASF